MQFAQNNFFTALKGLVTGGGLNSAGVPYSDSGFLTDVPVLLGSLDLNTSLFVDTSDAGEAFDVVFALGAHLVADETNARVVKVEEGTDDIFHLTFPIPRDYDEATDQLFVRVLASMISVSTDPDVELDAEFYIKTAGVALPADTNPTAPGTVLSATEQWLEFDLSGNSLVREQVPTFALITNGLNDTDGEEVLIHAVEYRYRSTLVSYNERDSANGCLR